MVLPLFAATVRFTVWVPEPEEVESVSQPGAPVMVQEQDGWLEWIWRVAAPPVEGKLVWEGVAV